MADAVDLVETGLTLKAEGKAENRPRARIPYPDGLFHYMAASAPSIGSVGLKCYASGRAGANFVVLLFSTETSALQAIVEADWLGRIRTGAASGVATRLLARRDARTAGVIGAGSQAQTQIEALAAVRELETIKIYSRSEERRRSLVDALQPRLNVKLMPVSSAEEAVRECEIVTTITTSREPVFDGHWLAPGSHVNAAGSNQARRREVDTTTVSRASVIAVDSLEQAQIEAGDLILAEEDGERVWDRAVELGDLLAGKAPFRRDGETITLFASQGLAIEDIMVAQHVLERARETGRGQEIDLEGRAG